MKYFFAILYLTLLYGNICLSQPSVISPEAGAEYDNSSKIKVILMGEALETDSLKSIQIQTLYNDKNQDVSFNKADVKSSNSGKILTLDLKLPQTAEYNCILKIKYGKDEIKSNKFNVQVKTDYDLSLGLTLNLLDDINTDNFYSKIAIRQDTAFLGDRIGASTFLSQGKSLTSQSENTTSFQNIPGNYDFIKDKSEITNKIVTVAGSVFYTIIPNSSLHISLGGYTEFRHVRTTQTDKFKITTSGKEKDSSFTTSYTNFEHTYGPTGKLLYNTGAISLTIDVIFGWTTNFNSGVKDNSGKYILQFLLKESSSGLGFGGEIRKRMFDGNINPTEFLVYFGKSFSLRKFIDDLVGTGS